MLKRKSFWNIGNQVKELGRFCSNLFSKEHYYTLGKVLKYTKRGDDVFKGTFKLVSVLGSGLLTASYISPAVGCRFLGLLYISIPAGYYLSKLALKSFSVLSSKKENLKSMRLCARLNNSYDLEKLIEISNVNDFDKEDRRELVRVMNRYKQDIDFYLNENIDFLRTIKDKKLRRIAFKNSDKYFSGVWDNKDIFEKVNLINDETRKDLCIEYLSRNSNYEKEAVSFFSEKTKYPETMLCALKNGARYTYEFEDLERYLDKFDDKIRDSAIRGIKSGLTVNSINDLNWYYDELTKTDEIKSLVCTVLDKGERKTTKNSLDIIKNLGRSGKDGSDLIHKISGVGKKKRISVLRHLQPVIMLYGVGAAKFVLDYSEKNGFDSLKDIEHELEQRICEMFKIEEIDSSINKADWCYLLDGYNKSDKSKTSGFFSAIFSGKSIWDYRHDFSKTSTISSNVKIDYWTQGYRNERVSECEFNIDFKNIALENYSEALKHLEQAGIDFEESSDLRINAENLLKKIEGIAGEKIVEAREHLQKSLDAYGSKKINSSRLIYRTGDLKDFAFIGQYPRETCLGLVRGNADCTYSMALQDRILPFIVSVEAYGKEVFVSRSLLRIYEDKLIVDDIYGEKVDFISEAHNFSQQLGLDLVIPVNMESRLSSKDIDYVVRNSSSNKETIEEKINGLIYSDAVPGKIKDRQINYSAFIIRRKVS